MQSPKQKLENESRAAKWITTSSIYKFSRNQLISRVMALKNVLSFSKEHNYGGLKGIGTEEFM